MKKDKTSGNPNPKVFRHHLEDYLERNTHFKELWEYLECSSDVPEETIEIVNKKPEKKSKSPDSRPEDTIKIVPNQSNNSDRY